MHKQISSRISFASLKQDRNKQKNCDISFQTMKDHSNGFHSQSQTSFISDVPLKNKINTQGETCKQFSGHNFQNIGLGQNNEFCNETSSKFASIIKQKQKNQNFQSVIQNCGNMQNCDENYQNFENSFVKVQRNIRKQIQNYNTKYMEITELLADLHIKDIMKLNQILQKNEQLFQQCKNNLNSLQNVHFLQSGSEQIKGIYEVQRVILRVLDLEPNKSFDFRSTFQSKNNRKTFSGSSSQVSPQLTKLQNSQIIRQKKSSKTTKFLDSYEIGSLSQKSSSDVNNLCQKSRKCQKSQKSSQNQTSFQCEKSLILEQSFQGRKGDNILRVQNKNSLKQNMKNQQNILSDTPQSVKSRISFTSKIKNQSKGVAMFDKILVCQSIEEMDKMVCVSARSQNPKGKSRMRYGQLCDDI